MEQNAKLNDGNRANSIDTQSQDTAEQLVKEFRRRAESRREEASSLFSIERSRHFAAATAYDNAADMLEAQVLRK